MTSLKIITFVDGNVNNCFLRSKHGEPEQVGAQPGQEHEQGGGRDRAENRAARQEQPDEH